MEPIELLYEFLQRKYTCELKSTGAVSVIEMNLGYGIVLVKCNETKIRTSFVTANGLVRDLGGLDLHDPECFESLVADIETLEKLKFTYDYDY